MFCFRDPATVLIFDPEAAYHSPNDQIRAVAKGVFPFFRASMRRACWKRRIAVPGR